MSDFNFTFHFPALEKEMATHSSVLAWRIPGTGSLVGCRLWGRTESDTTAATQQQQQQAPHLPHPHPGPQSRMGFRGHMMQKGSHHCLFRRLKSTLQSQGLCTCDVFYLQCSLPRITHGSHFAFSSVQFSRSVTSNSLRPHESQHARPPCPSPTPGVHSDSRPSSQ